MQFNGQNDYTDKSRSLRRLTSPGGVNFQALCPCNAHILHSQYIPSAMDSDRCMQSRQYDGGMTGVRHVLRQLEYG